MLLCCNMHGSIFFIGNFFEIPYEKTLREDAHAAVRKLSPNGDQRRRAKSACGLCSNARKRTPLKRGCRLTVISGGFCSVFML